MRKLTESDKKEILKLYRESAETTSTLAERYGVSNSTISRLLKSTLPEDEYEYLVSLKRAARTPEGRAQVSYENIPSFDSDSFSQVEEKETISPTFPKIEEESVEEDNDSRQEEEQVEQVVVKKQPILRKVTKTTEAPRRVKRRSSAPTSVPSQKPFPVGEQLELLEEKHSEVKEVKTIPSPPQLKSIPSPVLDSERTEAKVIAEMFGEEIDDADDLEDLDDLLEDDFDDDDDDEEEDDFEQPTRFVPRRSNEPLVRVLPLSAAALPRTCYIVIDRAAELITRPLREFSELGEIPTPETQETTLPVFDNHRVAKRFSSKRDRVIKVPDSKVLHKARYQLQAKGITRLLIDGQVYSLSSV
ncbi:MAG: transposase [Rivularia sp. (in: cyanobacteria)]